MCGGWIRYVTNEIRIPGTEDLARDNQSFRCTTHNNVSSNRMAINSINIRGWGDYCGSWGGGPGRPASSEHGGRRINRRCAAVGCPLTKMDTKKAIMPRRVFHGLTN